MVKVVATMKEATAKALTPEQRRILRCVGGFLSAICLGAGLQLGWWVVAVPAAFVMLKCLWPDSRQNESEPSCLSLWNSPRI